jgi:hypothetical protein
MKRVVLFCFCVLWTNFANAQDSVFLDEAIQGAAQEIIDALPRGSTIVVYKFESPKEKFSNYVLDELTDILVKSGKVKVVDRKNKNLIDAELDFQFKENIANISDDTLASLTDWLGAQAILTGAIMDTGNYYRFRIRTLSTTAQVIAVHSASIAKEETLVKNLLADSAPRTSINWFAAGTLNIAFGLGSYLNGDIAGGLIVTGGYIAAIGFIVWEVSGLKYGDPLAGVPGTIGICLIPVTVVFGYIKPFLSRNDHMLAYILDGINVALVPDNRGLGAVRLSYTYKY